MFFDKKEFKGYWFETGTPTFLIEQIKKRNNLAPFIKESIVSSSSLKGMDYDRISNIWLLFQTGYLMIKKEDIDNGRPQYTMDFPNMEVREAFIWNLLEVYANKEPLEVESINKRIAKALKEKKAENLEKSLSELFVNITYDLTTEKESYYHSLFLLSARMSGYEVEGEVHTDKGRIDAVLMKEKEVIVVEIKYSKEKSSEEMVEEGLKQIKERKYYENMQEMT
ncbi:MAG: PD-(D/E)XK nuclease domain-containing protein [Endomicrobium sp.]|nr:PD-(D/E)XK nuclease domain-containing protein [Endomicrobium sp.]